jgi:phospholipase/lecithinase/hemolysin
MPPTAVKREFCRRLFRAGGATVGERQAFLDTLSDAAIKAQQDGKSLVATGSGGTSVQFELFLGWKPEALIELIDAARAWADLSTKDDALATITGPVRFITDDFRGYRP